MSEHTPETWPSLRAIVRYGEEGPELVQTTENVPTDTEVDASTLELFRAVTNCQFDGSLYGEHGVSIHRFEDVTVVHVPEGKNAGIVGTFETEMSELDHTVSFLVEFLQDY